MLAGDRWQVTFAARVLVDVTPGLLAGTPEESLFQDIRAALGDRVAYTYETVRHFVDSREKDDALGGMRDHFLEADLEYISRPDFPRKLVLRKFRQQQVYTPPYLRV